MYIFISFALAFALWFSAFFYPVHAGIFILQPELHSICRGGQDCVVTWLDDGTGPLLSSIGVCTIGLYHGKQQLVQTLQAADVSSAHSFTFQPDAAAGPNSDGYYISFISTSFNVDTANSSLPYAAFSPFFTLEQMTGSFDHPLPEATSTHPIPPSLTSLSHTEFSTVTVGTLSTSLPPLPIPTTFTKPVSSPFSSSSTPRSTMITSTLTSPTLSPNSSSTTATSGGPAPPVSSNSASSRATNTILLPLFIVPLLYSAW